jgi:hypothetical protein
MKISPVIARKLIWKDACHRICGLSPTIIAAAKVRAEMVLRCRPRSSAARNRLAMMAALVTGGCIPVIRAYSQIMTSASHT